MHKYACTNSPKAVKGEGGKWRGKVERGKKWEKWRGGLKEEGRGASTLYAMPATLHLLFLSSPQSSQASGLIHLSAL